MTRCVCGAKEVFMDFSQMTTLEFWNGLVRSHTTELILILTTAVVVVLDRYLRRAVAKVTSSFNVVSRFAVFLLMCAVGYTALALGVSFALKAGIALKGGLYAAPAVLAILIIVAIEAQRQKAI